MNPTLLVEVGGTHTRCALSTADIHSIKVFANADYRDLASVLHQYFAELADGRPSKALVAVAAPVIGERVHLTNLGWVVDRSELVREFGLTQVHLVNDFAALACAIPYLPSRDLVMLQDGQPGDKKQNVAILGPGTGLGVSGLVYCRDHWRAISGEGGHVTLAATDEQEQAVINRLRQRFGHVSAERALSGQGLLNIYGALNGGAQAEVPEDVTRLAQQGEAVAVQTLDLFFKFLGTVSADLALTLGARGGLYLGGGILPALRQHLEGSAFITRFRAKGRYSNYLTAIPVALIIAENPALLGLNHYPDG